MGSLKPNLIVSAGVGVDSPHNKWVYDTTQFDNILKKLKVVWRVTITLFALCINWSLFQFLIVSYYLFLVI